jgi:serine/threonine protein kinase
VELLAKIDHRNLVRLLGFTDKGNERIIITEYVPNGTLREHLDGKLRFLYCFYHLKIIFKSLDVYVYSFILQVNMEESWILINGWRLLSMLLMHSLISIFMQVGFIFLLFFL